jgi:hypothetical protein
MTSCWIEPRWALVGGFLLPLAVAVTTNIILFTRIIFALHKASQKRRVNASSLKQQSQAQELRAVITVSVLLGLAWLFAALIDTGEETSSLLFQYLFAIFVTLQGFAIFLFQCVLSESVRDATKKSSSRSRPTLPPSTAKAPTGKVATLSITGENRSSQVHSHSQLSSIGSPSTSFLTGEVLSSVHSVSESDVEVNLTKETALTSSPLSEDPACMDFKAWAADHGNLSEEVDSTCGLPSHALSLVEEPKSHGVLADLEIFEEPATMDV